VFVFVVFVPLFLMHIPQLLQGCFPLPVGSLTAEPSGGQTKGERLLLATPWALGPYSVLHKMIPFEQKEPDYMLWGCFRWSFASTSTPAGCLLQLIHGLDEETRDAKSHIKKVIKFRWAVWLRLRSLYASEHVKQRALGQEPTGRRSTLTSHLVHRSPLTTKATDSRTHAELSGGLLDLDTLTGQYSQT
jgi:hypothetical protein